MTKEEIVKSLNMIQSAIKKHRNLAMWGNVESKVRLRELRARKMYLTKELMQYNK